MTGDAGEPSSSGVDDELALDVIPLHSTNLLTVLDEDGTIRYESPAIERIYGYAPDELVGQRVTEYPHPDDRERVVEAFETVVSSEAYTVEAVEYRHRQADGGYCWVESVASSNPTPEGYYVVNTREISERKQRERELERKNDRLDRFTSVVSHDLRNPLNVAQLRVDLARRECDSDHLEDVAQAHERMESLITDLLTLARSGGETGQVEQVDLTTLGETCWGNVATTDATLVVETNRQIYADQSRVAQLLENLLRNSVEHGGEGVTITLGELDDEPGFYVADDGSGIPADERERVLESGYSTAAGTGFGLAIVTDIADSHGWDVTLTEHSGGGLRVEFTGVEFCE